MKNRVVTIDNKEEWISRSVVVSCVVLARNVHNELHVLINQRGPAMTNPGCWNIPGGYLDYDETLEECATRETWEECGVKINDLPKYLVTINSNPIGKKQNVLVIMCCVMKDNIEGIKLTSFNSENEEVSDIKFVNVRDIINYKLLDRQTEYIEKAIALYS